MRVVVGGTFDLLHAGHKALLSCAFEKAGERGIVYIGLSADSFANRKSHPVHPYGERRAELVRWIEESGFSASYMIEPLYDQYGAALTAEFDALIVSFETYPAGERINEKRKAEGNAPVELVCVPCVTAEDGKAVSTTRIYEGEITSSGAVREKKTVSGEREEMR
ncbi:MAG: pantetheine-phosphate adenylyltransferase [Methanocorpusculum sp.]|nr:pantetheine-phosphate adenylyltransferase [Methanocorpusculum sp.]